MNILDSEESGRVLQTEDLRLNEEKCFVYVHIDFCDSSMIIPYLVFFSIPIVFAMAYYYQNRFFLDIVQYT